MIVKMEFADGLTALFETNGCQFNKARGSLKTMGLEVEKTESGLIIKEWTGGPLFKDVNPKKQTLVRVSVFHGSSTEPLGSLE